MSDDKATSKMSPFQLEDALERLGQTAPERSQARMKAPEVERNGGNDDPIADADVFDRPTVLGPAPPSVRVEPSDVSVFTMILAAIYVALACVVLFGR